MNARRASVFSAAVVLAVSVLSIVLGFQFGTGGPSPLAIGAVVIAIVAIVISIQGHRRRVPIDRVAARLFEGRFESTCPGCGGDPFAGVRCCRRFPRGWSPLDLHGFWHEFAAAGSGRGRPGDARILFDTRTRDSTKARTDVQAEAWWRCRGPLGTSASHPRSGFGLQSGLRLLLRHRASARLLATLAALIIVGWMLANGTFNQVGSTVVVILVLTWMLFSYVRTWHRKAPIRVATRPRCGRCRHLLHPPFPERCTECGEELAAWDSITFNPDEPVITTATTRATGD